MQGIMKFTYLGMDDFTGKKDPTKKYYQASFLQGSEIAKIFLITGQEELFKDMQKFDEVECLVDFKLGQDRYGSKIDYRLISMTALMPDIPFDLDKSTPAGTAAAGNAVPPADPVPASAPQGETPKTDQKGKAVA